MYYSVVILFGVLAGVCCNRRTQHVSLCAVVIDRVRSRLGFGVEAEVNLLVLFR